VGFCGACVGAGCVLLLSSSVTTNVLNDGLELDAAGRFDVCCACGAGCLIGEPVFTTGRASTGAEAEAGRTVDECHSA
jgi:hypothetical protein